MTRDLRLQISGDATAGERALGRAEAALGKVTKELQAAEAKTDGLAAKARKLAEAEERAADKTRDLAAKAAALRKQIEETGDETGQLGTKLDRLTRDTKSAALAADDYRRAADRASRAAREQARDYDRVADNARQAARDVALLGTASVITPNGKSGGRGGVLGGLANVIPGLLGGGGGAAANGTSVASSLSGVGGPIVSTVTTGALAAGAASAAVPLLAAGGGALLGLGGIGAVGGGIAGAASQSSHVSDAFNKELDKVEIRFKKATYSWVGPTIDAIHAVGDAFDATPIEQIFDDARKYLPEIAKGTAGFATALGGGAEQLVKGAGPVVDKLSEKLPDFGKDLGDSLAILGRGADGAAEALGDVLHVAGGLAKALAGAAAVAGAAYDDLINVPVLKQGHELFLNLFSGFDSLPVTAGRALHSAAQSEDDYARSAAAAAQAVRDLDSAVEDHINNALASVNANVALERAQDGLAEGFKRGKSALDASTESGRGNIELITGLVEAADRARQAEIDRGDGTALASAKARIAYEAQIQGAEDLLVKLGVARDQAHAFLQQFLDYDGKVFTATVKVNVKYQEYNPGIALGNLLHHARGGEMPYSGFHVTGEHGPEVTWASRGAYTSTAEDTRKLAQMTSAGDSSGGGSTLSLRVMPGGDIGVAQLVQRLFAAGHVQVFDSNGKQISTRRG